MTTAHRPTWNSAQGGSEQGGNLLVNPSRAYSSKDLPAHTKLKVRHGEQLPDSLRVGTDQAVDQLESEFKTPDVTQLLGKRKAQQQVEDIEQEVKIAKNRPQDADQSAEEQPDSQDEKCDESNQNCSDNESDDESGESEEEDDELEVLREYEKLKKEREQQRIDLEIQKQNELQKEQEEQVLTGNPLLNQQLADATKSNRSGEGIYSLKKKWYDETVFKHQARSDPAAKNSKRRFINDTVRSDFHRKFLSRAIQ